MVSEAAFFMNCLDILLGIGFATFYYNVTHAEPYRLVFTPILLTSSIGVLAALISSLVLVPMNDWQGKRFYGLYLIALYLILMVINVVVEITVEKGG